MNIYLYVKTHNKTGLKYLGKTTSGDPHKYTGSGTYWKDHLRVHGNDYSTEIIKECRTIEELKQWGLYYSKLWNIVESNEWANFKEESGDGGAQILTDAYRAKISASMKGKIKNPETISKLAAATTAQMKNPEQIEKRRSQKIWNKGKKLSNEHRAKIAEAAKKRTHTLETKNKISATLKSKLKR